MGLRHAMRVLAEEWDDIRSRVPGDQLDVLASELVAEAVLALRLECTVEELIRTIHAHPTFAEAVGEAAHATHGAAIHL